MRFLIVDDSATMRRIIVNSLQRIGFTQYVEAADGEEALKLVDDSISCIISDWNMPNMTGIDFVRELRSRPETAQVPIIMITTRSVREDIIDAAQAGVNNYIVKPFTPQVLRDKIEHVMSARGAA
jgi:two-component system chemotaxis response regulator CheY